MATNPSPTMDNTEKKTESTDFYWMKTWIVTQSILVSKNTVNLANGNLSVAYIQSQTSSIWDIKGEIVKK